MPAGMTPWTGAMAPPDSRDQAMIDWQTTSGVRAESPLVGGPHIEGLGSRDIDRGRSVIVSLPGGHDSATGAGATSPGVALFDDWRDLFNFRGSPMPWLLMLALLMLGFAQLAVQARVGPVKAAASAG